MITTITYDLIQLVKDYTKDDRETILEIVELLDSIRNNPNNFTNDLEDKLDEFAKDKGLCPICGAELENNTYNANKLEYQGCECYEQHSQWYCPNHGYID